MFLIKICGLTSVPDAFGAMDAGADAVGLNFFSQSKRRVDVGIAREICAELPKSVLRVGVFVNHEPHEILEIVARVGLDLVQLHGDERPGVGSSLSAFPVLRAVRCRGVEDVPSVVAWVNAYRDTGEISPVCSPTHFIPENTAGPGSEPTCRHSRNCGVTCPICRSFSPAV